MNLFSSQNIKMLSYHTLGYMEQHLLPSNFT
jgi:hypothetical protein